MLTLLSSPVRFLRRKRRSRLGALSKQEDGRGSREQTRPAAPRRRSAHTDADVALFPPRIQMNRVGSCRCIDRTCYVTPVCCACINTASPPYQPSSNFHCYEEPSVEERSSPLDGSTFIPAGAPHGQVSPREAARYR